MWPNPVSIVPFVPLRNRKQNSAVYGSEETGGTGEWRGGIEREEYYG